MTKSIFSVFYISEHTTNKENEMEFQELIEEFMKHRCLLIREEITKSKVDIVATAFSLLDFKSAKPIWVHIDSEGGDVNAARNLGDAFQMARSPVYGLVTGIAASSAFVLLQMCDRRISYPNARLLFHGISTRVGIDDPDFKFRVRNAKLLHKKNLEELAVRSGQPMSKIRRWSRMERMFSAQEALELGFLDAIEQPRKKR